MRVLLRDSHGTVLGEAPAPACFAVIDGCLEPVARVKFDVHRVGVAREIVHEGVHNLVWVIDPGAEVDPDAEVRWP